MLWHKTFTQESKKVFRDFLAIFVLHNEYLIYLTKNYKRSPIELLIKGRKNLFSLFTAVLTKLDVLTDYYAIFAKLICRRNGWKEFYEKIILIKSVTLILFNYGKGFLRSVLKSFLQNLSESCGFSRFTTSPSHFFVSMNY